MRIAFTLEPIDTLFFRDGAPFSSESASQAEVGGQFPPSPFTVAGAIRVALARSAGWNGYSRWSSDLKTILGEEANDLGKLSFTGPFVICERDGETTTLFPMPMHVVGRASDGSWTPRQLLCPGRPVHCDLGTSVRLPTLPKMVGDQSGSREDGDKLETTREFWITKKGLASILKEQSPDANEVVKPPWELEPRIGLRIDSETRTAADAQLYTTKHIRLKNGVKLAVLVDEVPETWPIPERQLVPLGGESRVAGCVGVPGAKQLCLDSPLSAIGSSGRLAMVALTPVDIDPPLAGRRVDIPGLNADVRIVSACVERPLRIGGWDSALRRPLPLSNYLAPGSVIFTETTNKDALADYLSHVPTNGYLRIGNNTRFGFGLVAITTWSSED